MKQDEAFEYQLQGKLLCGWLRKNMLAQPHLKHSQSINTS